MQALKAISLVLLALMASPSAAPWAKPEEKDPIGICVAVPEKRLELYPPLP
jgi:hypothetical protein